MERVTVKPFACVCVQVGISCPDPDVCGLHPHHEVSVSFRELNNWLQ